MSLFQPWSLRELVSDLSSGRVNPADALSRSRARIDATDADVRAWVEVTADPLVEGAVRGGPLDGVPLGVKDIIDLAGHPTRCGSVLRAEAEPAARDAAIVSAWREVGVVPVGKTVTTEFAFFAPGPTHNPAAPGHTPGGSSSGSAAAVAAGHVPLALGSQTAGSVTRPASFCGVASLVMSHGRYPVDGVVGLSGSLDSHGLIATTVSDVAVAWSALTGAEDVGASEPDAPHVLLWSGETLDAVEPSMRDALKVAVRRLQAAGSRVEPFPLEALVAELTALHPVIMAYEASRERAVELASADRLSAPLANLLRAGAVISDDVYAQAIARVGAARGAIADLLADGAVVLGPAASGAAPEGLAATGDPVMSRAWQTVGLPTVAVPGLSDDAGLPLGLQIVGPAGGEAPALAAGCWIERHLA